MDKINYALLSRNLEEAIKKFYEDESSALDKLYDSNPKEIGQLERTELIERSINIVSRIQDTVTKILKQSQVEYVATIWGMVSEKLSAPAYIYVDWESIKNNNEKSYSTRVDEKNFEKVMNEDKTLPISGLPLVAGTVAGILLFIGGHPVIAIATVAGAAFGGYVVRISSVKKTTAQEKSFAGKTVAYSEDIEKSAIEVARNENKKILAAWCSNVKDLTIQMCRKNEEFINS